MVVEAAYRKAQKSSTRGVYGNMKVSIPQVYLHHPDPLMKKGEDGLEGGHSKFFDFEEAVETSQVHYGANLLVRLGYQEIPGVEASAEMFQWHPLKGKFVEQGLYLRQKRGGGGWRTENKVEMRWGRGSFNTIPRLYYS